MEKRIQGILSQMTLEEKCSLLSGLDFWHLQPVEHLGLPAIMITDGPHGLRRQRDDADHLGLNASVPATAFPTGAGLGASWNRDLIEEVGGLIAEEALAQGVSVVLGPACNIKRSPLCGRSFEYLSEDPFLSAQMAKHHIMGIQSKGVGASIKHFCANNQESRRMTVDTIVDERTLREIYLASFETAVKEAKPWTVMCSYNKLNGTYMSENKRLLSEVLRDEWGYDGAVVSDWGAVNDRPAGVAAGMDLEMPASGGINDRKVLDAVQNGQLSEAVLDKMASRLIRLILQAKDKLQPDADFDEDQHHVRAREIAGECMVLLKNDNALLPLSPTLDFALIGSFAEMPRCQGGGSSHINPTRVSKALIEIHNLNPSIKYAPGFDINSDELNPQQLEEALKLAENAGTAVIMAGLPDRYESEGYDRRHMNLPPNQNELIRAVAAVCPQVIVVLTCGSPVEMPWIEQVAAVVAGYLPGQAGAAAVADLLFGKVNPSGKLAETFPLRLSDNPSYLNFPGYNDRVEYNEGIYVGYRYYDKKDLPVLFPFGHGLSYTTFEYTDLQLDKIEMTEDEHLTVSVRVKNTGKVPGKEIIQLYLAYPQGKIPRPPLELKGFYKIALKPGEEKTVKIILDRRSFAYYDLTVSDWLIESGPAEIIIGASSRDVRLKGTVQLTALRRPFVKLTINSTRQDLLSHPASAAAARPFFDQLGSIFAAPEQKPAQKQAAENPDDKDRPAEDGFSDMMAEMQLHIPLRALIAFSGGAISEKSLQQLIDQCNKAMSESM